VHNSIPIKHSLITNDDWLLTRSTSVCRRVPWWPLGCRSDSSSLAHWRSSPRCGHGTNYNPILREREEAHYPKKCNTPLGFSFFLDPHSVGCWGEMRTSHWGEEDAEGSRTSITSWWALETKVRPLAWLKVSDMSWPKVYPAPLGEMPQPPRSSGSDHNKSHIGPWRDRESSTSTKEDYATVFQKY